MKALDFTLQSVLAFPLSFLDISKVGLENLSSFLRAIEHLEKDKGLGFVLTLKKFII